MASNDKGLEDIPEGMRRVLFFFHFVYTSRFSTFYPIVATLYFIPLTQIKSQDHGY